MANSVFLDWLGGIPVTWSGSDLSIGGNLLPSANNTYTLGDASYEWADLFLGSGGVINWNNGDVTLTHSSAALTMKGTLKFSADNTYDIGANGATRPKDIIIAGKLYAESASSAAARFSASADGVALLTNYAGTDFTRLQFGGTTSSFPALKRSGANLQVRVADDSGYGSLTADALTSVSNMTVGSFTGYTEIVDPAAPSANGARLYAVDNGAGKTQLVVRFNTGAVQVIATEP